LTKKDLLNNYRTSVIELEELRRQLSRLGTDGRPAGVRTVTADAIHGTNDPAAAALQLAEGLEDMLQRKEAEHQALKGQVDALLRGIRDSERTWSSSTTMCWAGRTNRSPGQCRYPGAGSTSCGGSSLKARNIYVGLSPVITGEQRLSTISND